MNRHIWVIEIFDPRMDKMGWIPMASLFYLQIDDEAIPTTYGTKKEAEFNRKRIVKDMKGSLVAIRYRVRKYIRDGSFDFKKHIEQHQRWARIQADSLPPHLRTKGLPRRTVKFYGG